MNDKLQKLYELYTSSGLIKNTSFEKFSTATDQQRQKLYDLGKSSGLFKTTDFDKFNSAFITEPVEETPEVKKKDVSESSSEDGSSDSGKSRWAESIEEDKTVEGVRGISERPEMVTDAGGTVKGPAGMMETGLSRTNELGTEVFEGEVLISESDIEAISKGTDDKFLQEQDKKLTEKWKADKMAEDPFGRTEEYWDKMIEQKGKESIIREVAKTPEQRKKELAEQETKDALTEAGIDYNYVIKMNPNQIQDFISKDYDDVFFIDNKTATEWGFLSPDRMKGEFKTYASNLVEAAANNPYGDDFGGNKSNIDYAVDGNMANKWFSQREMDIRHWNRNLGNKWQDYAAKVEQYNNSSFSSPEVAKKAQAELKAQRADLLKQQRFIDVASDRLGILKEKYNKTYLEKYVAEKEKKAPEATLYKTPAFEVKDGGFLSSTWRMLSKGLTTTSETAGLLGSELASKYDTDSPSAREMIRMEETGAKLTDLRESEATRAFLDLREEGLEAISGVSSEYINSSDRSTLQQGWNAAVESLGVAASGMGFGGGVASKAAFFTQSYNALESEMADEKFDGLSSAEKLMISAPYAMVVSSLERFGFKMTTGALKNFKGIDRTIAQSLKLVPKGASPEVIQRAIDNNIKAKFAAGLLKIEAGALVETGTEDLQKGFEIGIKAVTNQLKEHTYFEDVPNSMGELASQLWEETKVAFVASQVFGLGGASVSSIQDGISNKTSDLQFEVQQDIIMDPHMRGTAYGSIKKRVQDGEITKEEGEAQVNAIKQSYAILDSMPEGMTTKQRRESFNLINERNKLEREVEGKDKALVDDKLQRIKDINEELKIISKTEAATEEIVSEGTFKEQPQTNPVTIETDQEGSFINVGLLKGQTNEVITEQDIRDNLPADVEVVSVTQINPETGTVQEPTASIELSRELTPEEMFNLRKATDQMAIPQLSGKKGVMYGTLDWGDFNPDYFIMPDGRTLSQTGGKVAATEVTTEVKAATETGVNQITKENAEEFASQAETEVQADIVKAANSVLGALEKSGVKVFLHKTTDEYNQAIADRVGKSKEEIDMESEEGKASRGEFLSSNEIHINLQVADKKTVFHEAFHAVLANNGFTQEQITELTSAIKTGTKNKELIAKAEKLEKEYEQSEMNEEFASEFVGLLSSQDVLASPTLMQKIMAAIGRMLGLDTTYTKKQDYIDFVNDVSAKLRRGEDIQTPGEGGEVGTFNIPSGRKKQKAPSSKDDSRGFINKFVEDVDLREFNGQNFVTNMYDYTGAGVIDLGNGNEITLLGGKNYVPYMMDINGKSIGDVSNLAAFNTKAQAETFVRNAIEGNASLFAPHSGTLSNSWQFQQHTFSELVNLVLDNGILSEKDLIKTFNDAIKNNAQSKKAFKAFRSKYGERINNLSSFKNNPKKIVELLDIKNNYSPDLRKVLNNAISANKVFQEAIGVKNKNEFYNRIMDPMNEGVVGGEIMGVVKFDPDTFEIVQTRENDAMHHPSFGWTLLAKIDGIYQPTEFHRSSNVTDTYTKYNTDGKKVSRKSEDKNFEQRNVSSSAGAIPKVAKVDVKRKKQILPDEAHERLTEDGKGNYVFHNYGSTRKSTLKPSLTTGAGLQTSKEEARAINSVGGVVMFYTESNQKEAFTGDELHTVLIPKDKVYPLRQDPDGFYDEAKRQFQEKMGNQAFDANMQAAWIGKVAVDNGYMALLAPWKDGYRLQTTMELTPEAENIQMKEPIKKDEDYKVGDDVVVYGSQAKVTAVDGSMVSFEGEGGSGTINIAGRAKANIKKQPSRKKQIAWKEVSSTELNKKDLNAARTAIRNRDKNSSTLQILDEVAKALRGDDFNLPFDLDYLADGITYNDLASLVIDEGMFETLTEAKKFISDRIISKDLPSRKKQISGDGKKDNKRVETVNKAKNSYYKAKETGKNDQDAYNTAITALENSSWYNSANDIQRESAVRQLRKQIGIKEKSSPSIAKILGKPKDKKITISDRVALAEKLRALTSGERTGRLAEKKVRRAIAKELMQFYFKGLRGKVNAPKLSAVVNKALSMNLSNPVMAQRFFDYVNKVVKDVEHANKLTEAYRLRKAIRRMSKNQQVGLSIMARRFSSFDPTIVDDIDQYIGTAKRVEAALKRTKIWRGELLFRDKVNIGGVTAYANAQIQKQEEINKDMVELKYPELFESGILNREMTLQEMMDVISNIDPDELGDAGITEEEARAEVIESVESDIESLKEILETGKDPWSGMDLNIDSRDKEAMKGLLDLDPETLSTQELFTYADVVMNVVHNIDTGNITAFVNKIVGAQNAQDFFETHGSSQVRTKFGREYLKFLGSLDLVVENVFASGEVAREFMAMSGLSEFSEQAIRTQAEVTKIVKEYTQKYHAPWGKTKKKPNGKAFDAVENVYERGMYAFLTRSKGGDAVDIRNEFNRRRKLVLQSIEELKRSKNKEERTKGSEYEAIAKKLGLDKDGVNIMDIQSRVDKINKSAVNWWIDKWSEYREDMAATAKVVYNKELDTDINYTPDRFKKRAGLYEREAAIAAAEGVAMSGQQGIFSSEAGSLMDTKNPQKLPADRYIDLDFDTNNARMIEEALVDTRTAASTRTLQGFLKSEAFSNMFKDQETEALISQRVTEYVNRKRKKTLGTAEEIETLKTISNIAAKTGTIYSLATMAQPVKQTIPIALATMLKAGNFPNLGIAFDNNYIKWLEDNGVGIAIRGLESDTAIERAEINLKKNAKILRKAGKAMDGLGEVYLKTFLAYPDKIVARASFDQYYRQGLKRYGIDEEVDYSKPMNDKAKRYANAMVTRMQNASDPDKAGNLWTSRNWAVSTLRKTAFPFANFIINQKVRMYTDIKKLASTNNATEKADAFKSLAVTFGVEVPAYHLLSAFTRYLYTMAANAIVGGDEAEEDEAITRLVKKENERREAEGQERMSLEEEREFRAGRSDTEIGKEVAKAWYEKELKTIVTSIYKDMASPLPTLDDAFVFAFNESAKMINKDSLEKDIKDEISRMETLAAMRGEELSDYDREQIEKQVVEEKTFQLWSFDDDSWAKSYGTIGITIDKYKEYLEARSMANKGVFENKKGEPMFLVEEDQEIAKDNYVMERLFMSALIPADAGSVARKVSNRLKERALSAGQFVDYNEYRDIIDEINKDRPEGEEIPQITEEERIMVSRGDGSFKDVLKKTRGEFSEDFIIVNRKKYLRALDIKTEAETLTKTVNRDLNRVNEMLKRNGLK